MNMRLEVVIVPVSDVDRAKAFYEKAGFRLDIDLADGNLRALQFTPPRSEASIIFGKGDWYARYLHARQQGSSPEDAATAADLYMEKLQKTAS